MRLIPTPCPNCEIALSLLAGYGVEGYGSRQATTSNCPAVRAADCVTAAERKEGHVHNAQSPVLCIFPARLHMASKRLRCRRVEAADFLIGQLALEKLLPAKHKCHRRV
jgi:hypothetical protein